jgi:beta-N-acetylhexosaminidase
MNEVELVPFRAAIGAGVDGIMTAHLSVPALEKAGTPTRPATLSPTVLTGMLRNELGFGGLVVTDGLNMDGVRKGRSPGEVAVEAVQAGADILLMPPAVGEAIDAVVAAIDAGTVALSRIEASVRRILLAKATVGLDRERLTDPRRWPTALGAAEHQAWAERVAGESITLVRQGPAGLPRIAGRRILSVVYDDAARSAAGEAFQMELEKQGAKVTTVRLSRQSKAAALKEAERAAAGAEVVVFSSYARGSSPERGGVALPEAVGALANRLAAKGAVVFSFGDPYLLGQLPRTRSYLLAWSETDAAQRAAARALGGARTIAGRLPIPLPPTHALGEGITLPALASRPGGAPDAAATIR